MVAYVVVGAVFGVGVVVAVALLVGRVRDRRRWGGPSIDVVAGSGFEDPAAGGSTAGAESDTTGAWANGQTGARVIGINTSPYGNGSLPGGA